MPRELKKPQGRLAQASEVQDGSPDEWTLAGVLRECWNQRRTGVLSRQGPHGTRHRLKPAS